MKAEDAFIAINNKVRTPLMLAAALDDIAKWAISNPDYASRKQEMLDIIPLDEKQLSWLIAELDWISMSTWNKLEFDNYF